MKKELSLVGFFLLIVTTIALLCSFAIAFLIPQRKKTPSLKLLTNYIKQLEPFATKVIYLSDDNTKESYIITNTEDGSSNIIEINFINKNK